MSDALQFDEDSHTYRLGGRIVPGVTTVLQLLDDSLKFVDPVVLAAAAEFGTHVHEACHLHNVGDLDETSLDPFVGEYLNGWRKFLDDTGMTILESERRVLHRTMFYAGTLDAIGITGAAKRPTLIDIKTGSTVPRTVGPQTAAYAAATGQSLSRMCVQLLPNGYTLTRLNNPADFDHFKAALTCYRWRHKL